MFDQSRDRFAVIVAAGSQADEDAFYAPLIAQATCTVAADAGLRVFYRLGVRPDIFIGDGDSVGGEEWQWAQQTGVPTQTFPREKDATDTQLALDFLLDRGERNIRLLGGIGSRLDHTLANVYLLVYADERDARLRLCHPRHQVQLVTPERSVELHGASGDLVSIVPISETLTGVEASGFRWNLCNATLRRGTTVGVSNYLTAGHAQVSIKTGMALVMKVKES